MNLNERIRQVYVETKVELVKLNGVSHILIHMGSSLIEDDNQRIKCELERKGSIAAWDMLIDVLKSSGLKAFKNFLKAINSPSFPAPKEVLERFEKVCIANDLEDIWRDSLPADEFHRDDESVATNNELPLQDLAPGRRTERENSLLSNATGSSFESERSRAWSTDSSEVFGASAQNSFDDSYANGAKKKRERFSSSGSREAIENGSRRSRGSLKSTGSRGSIEDAFPTSILDPICKLRPQQRRQLSDCLNKQSHLGNDWRMVAEKLGFDSETIAKISTASDQMSVVLDQMSQRTQTIRILVEILQEMGRLDCIDILRKGGILDISSTDTDLNVLQHLQRTSSQVDETNPLPLQESARKQKDFQEDKIPSSSSDKVDHVEMPVQERSEEKDPNQATKSQRTSTVKESIQEPKPKFISEESKPHGKGTFISKPIDRLGKSSEGPTVKKNVNEEKPTTTCCTYILSIDSKVTSKAKYSPVTPLLLQNERPKTSSRFSSLSVKGARVCGHPEAGGSIPAADETSQESKADSSHAETFRSLALEDGMLIKSEKGWMTSKDFRQEFESDTDLSGSAQGRNREQSNASLTDAKQEEDGEYDEDGATPRGCQLASPSDDGFTKKIELLGNGERRQVFDSMEVKEKLVDPIKVENLESSVEFDQAKFTQVRNPSCDTDSGELCSPTIAEVAQDSLSTASEVPQESPQSSPLFRLKGASNVNKSKEKETANAKSPVHPSKGTIPAHNGNRSTPVTPAEDKIERNATSLQSYSQTSTTTLQASEMGKVMTKLGSSSEDQPKAKSSKKHRTPMLCDDETTQTVLLGQNPGMDTGLLSSNPGSFSSISTTIKSLLSGFFDSMGLGRQPTFPARRPEDANSPDIAKRQISFLSRQFSTTNAVPSENYDEDERPPDSVEEVLVTDGGKEICIGASADVKEINEESTDLAKRFALIIDNHDYKDIESLPSENHSSRLARCLEDCGWEVERHTNLTKKNLQSVIEEFSRKTKSQMSFVFYYGHSMKAQGVTYILPVDMQPQHAKTKSNRKKYAVDLDALLEKVSVAEASTVVIDAGHRLGNMPFECPTTVQHRNNQCVFLAKRTILKDRFIAELLANRLIESATIRTIKDFMKPIEQYFEISTSSRRYLPVIVKATDPMEGRRNCWRDEPNSSWRKHAFMFKSNGSWDDSQLKDKWLVNQCRDAADLDGDINAFMKVLDNDDPKVCLFYYEGPIAMENGELMLCPSDSCNASCEVERKELSWILGRFSEIVVGPRIVIINATNVAHDRIELNFDDLNLQEVLLAISPAERTIKEVQQFHHELIQALAEERDIKDYIIGISEKFGFQTICNSLFHV